MTVKEYAKIMAKELAEEFELILERHLKTCLNCDNFNKATEICKLANARPPAKVICTGCPSFSEEVPF